MQALQEKKIKSWFSIMYKFGFKKKIVNIFYVYGLL